MIVNNVIQLDVIKIPPPFWPLDYEEQINPNARDWNLAEHFGLAWRTVYQEQMIINQQEQMVTMPFEENTIQLLRTTVQHRTMLTSTEIFCLNAQKDWDLDSSKSMTLPIDRWDWFGVSDGPSGWKNGIGIIASLSCIHMINWSPWKTKKTDQHRWVIQI